MSIFLWHRPTELDRPQRGSNFMCHRLQRGVNLEEDMTKVQIGSKSVNCFMGKAPGVSIYMRKPGV